MRFIGDIHGEYDAYRKIIAECDQSIQVGDHGLGFGPAPTDISTNHRFIRGNHDCLGKCLRDPRWISDGTVEGTQYGPMMFIGGAWSCDQAYRTPGKTWWFDEELSEIEFQKIFEVYRLITPNIMVTHDVPSSIKDKIHSHHRFDKDFTSGWLQVLFEEHKPDLWIAGHHHVLFNEEVDGCTFVVIPVCSFFDMDL